MLSKLKSAHCWTSTGSTHRTKLNSNVNAFWMAGTEQVFCTSPNQSLPIGNTYIGRIPVRNLWLLMLYASDLFRWHHKANIALDESPAALPDIIAKILTTLVG